MIKMLLYRIPICETCQAMNAEIALEAAEYLLDGQRDTLWDKQSGHREETNLPERQERWAEGACRRILARADGRGGAPSFYRRCA